MNYATLNGSKVFKVASTKAENSIECPDYVEAGWLYGFEGFSPPPGSLDFAKKQKNSYINSLRNIKLEEPILYKGNLYDADRDSSSNLVAVVSAINAGIPLPLNFAWRTAGNINVILSAQEVIELAATMLATSNSIYNQSWGLKAQITSATNIEELNSIVW